MIFSKENSGARPTRANGVGRPARFEIKGPKLMTGLRVADGFSVEEEEGTEDATVDLKLEGRPLLVVWVGSDERHDEPGHTPSKTPKLTSTPTRGVLLADEVLEDRHWGPEHKPSRRPRLRYKSMSASFDFAGGAAAPVMVGCAVFSCEAPPSVAFAPPRSESNSSMSRTCGAACAIDAVGNTPRPAGNVDSPPSSENKGPSPASGPPGRLLGGRSPGPVGVGAMPLARVPEVDTDEKLPPARRDIN